MSFIKLNTSDIMYLHPQGEVVSDVIRYTNNFFEPDFLNYLKLNHKDQSEIIDIGANIGNHSLFFAKYLNCNMVHCFEPYEPNVKLLEYNTKSLSDKVKIYKCALSNKESEMPLYNSQSHNFGGFSLHSYSNGSSFKVIDSIKTYTLDSYGLTNISLIKIDVENHENEVLEGAKQTIELNKPIIFLENLHHGYPNIVPEKEPHLKIMKSYGYKKINSNICGSYMDLWIYDSFS
jgi:protein O-GlcNAc transferase